MGALQIENMADTKHLDQIAERVERLLLRHEALQHSNGQLRQQLQALQAERDSLQSRLNAARARIDALLDRLPQTPASTLPNSTDTRQERA